MAVIVKLRSGAAETEGLPDEVSWDDDIIRRDKFQSDSERRNDEPATPTRLSQP